jgi:hypothetical protein
MENKDHNLNRAAKPFKELPSLAIKGEGFLAENLLQQIKIMQECGKFINFIIYKWINLFNTVSRCARARLNNCYLMRLFYSYVLLACAIAH